MADGNLVDYAHQLGTLQSWQFQPVGANNHSHRVGSGYAASISCSAISLWSWMLP
jgi:hypothetical protein